MPQKMPLCMDIKTRGCGSYSSDEESKVRPHHSFTEGYVEVIEAANNFLWVICMQHAISVLTVMIRSA